MKSCRFRIAVVVAGLSLGLGLGCGHSDDASRRSEGPRVEHVVSPRVGPGVGARGGAFGPGAGEVAPTGPALGGGNPESSGLDRHDALYCGEWQLTALQETIFLVKGGKVVWTHAIGDSDELGDCTLTSYGTVLFSRKAYGAQEIKVDLASGKGGEIVWEYRQDAGSEVHAVQPIGVDQVMVMQNSTPPKLMIIDKKAARSCRSGDPCVKRLWNPPTPSTNVHGMFRHVRILASGNLLVPYTAGNFEGESRRVVEYEPGPGKELKEVWEYRFTAPGSAWAAVRLANGNTLISGNSGGWVREVNRESPAKVVWSVEKNEFPAPMYVLQGAVRLANGNTIVANWVGPERNRDAWKDLVQYFEITPDKKFVWQLKQWNAPNLGPGSCMQPLDQPGIPENPGEQAR